MYKVLIKKSEKHPTLDCDKLSEFISIDAVKPHDIKNDEWSVIGTAIRNLATGVNSGYCRVIAIDCIYDLYQLNDNLDGDILAESEHFFIRREYEEAILFRKADSKRITCVGDFYGDPEDAYIDAQEKYCIIVGCGIVKYYLVEPFEEYRYDTYTLQWIETGRKKDSIEWCDCIEQVTESYLYVSCEGNDIRCFNIDTLQLEN